MKLFVIATVAGLACAAPTQGAINTPAGVALPNNLLPFLKGAAPIVSGNAETKRDVERRQEPTLTVDVWQDADKKGKHEGMLTTAKKCYNINVNGWNDVISSIEIPEGFACTFYKDIDCHADDYRLTIYGHTYVSNLKNLNFNDMISSYLCTY